MHIGDVEQARQQDEDRRGQAKRLRQEVGLGEHEGRDGHISEIIDDEVETLAAEARQHVLHLEQARQGPVDGVDQERDTEPDEHHLPIGLMSSAERQEREHGADGGQHMDRGSP